MLVRLFNTLILKSYDIICMALIKNVSIGQNESGDLEMKTITSIVGIILIVIGVAAFAYQGFSYTKRENIAQIGTLKITADTQKTVYVPPVLGGLSIVAGLALVFIGRRFGK